ncbi:MAG: signal peptidase II [Oscillospiraceae bacterium]|nr:signal peptidase II [Oscillospiraceae bacterium]
MILSVIFFLLAFLLDRAVKMFVLNNFVLGETRGFIPGILQLTYAQNTGVAFGFLANHQWIPLVLTPLIMIGLGVLLWKNVFPCPVCRLALVAVMAGGLSNWIDRIAYGFVVDMFETVFMRFAIFNVADIFITVGGGVFLVAYFLKELRTMRENKGSESTEPEQTEPSGE